jgi:hypothetical protein
VRRLTFVGVGRGAVALQQSGITNIRELALLVTLNDKNFSVNFDAMPTTLVSCAHCQTAFRARRSTATYCCSTCRTLAYYDRKGIGATPNGKTTKPTAPSKAISGPSTATLSPKPMSQVESQRQLLEAQIRALGDRRIAWVGKRERILGQLQKGPQNITREQAVIGGVVGIIAGGLTGSRKKFEYVHRGRGEKRRLVRVEREVYDDGEKLALMVGGGALGAMFGAGLGPDGPRLMKNLEEANRELTSIDVSLGTARKMLATLPPKVYFLPLPAAEPLRIASPAPGAPAGAKKALSGGQIISSKELAEMKFRTMGFEGEWLELMGDPAEGFYAIVSGPPKHGKSTLCARLANYVTRFGRVLYVAAEEGLGHTLQKKIQPSAHLDVSGPLPAAELLQLAKQRAYGTIVLDSVNRMQLEPAHLEEMKGLVNLVAVLQSTKSGNFRGSKEWEHNAEIIIELDKPGHATQRGRYKQGGEYEIFSTPLDERAGRLPDKTLG